MGGSSFFARKKKSPLNKAWSQLRGALPTKKRGKLKLNLGNLGKKKKKTATSPRRFSLPTDKTRPKKRFSLSNIKKKLLHADSRGKKKKKKEKEKEKGGLGKVGEQLKRTFSHEPSAQQKPTPADAGPKSGPKGSRMTLQEVMRSVRAPGSRSAGQKNDEEV